MARPEKQFDWSKIDAILQYYKIYRSGFISRNGKKIKPWRMKKGHLQVNLSINGHSKKFLVHRLVAWLYIDNEKNKPCVNHIDGNPQNNNVNNLEWCTDAENKHHAKENRMFQQSTNRYNSKFDDCQILTIHTIKSTHITIAKQYNVSQSVITRIKNFKTYKNFAVIQ